MTDFTFLGSKITTDGDCSHEIKRHLLLARKVRSNLDSISKSRDITLPIKVQLVKAMVFPMVMYRCESWTIKKLSVKELMLLNCGVREDSWESLELQGNPTSPSEKKSVLNIHWKDWYWSWNSNTLATLHKELTHWKRPWCWERLKAGGEGDDRGWDGWMASPTPWAWIWVNSRSWWWTGGLVCCSTWGCKESDTTERLNWPETKAFLRGPFMALNAYIRERKSLISMIYTSSLSI